MGTNIILITDESSVEKFLKPKLVLLREIDNILTTDYSNAILDIKKYSPKIVLIYGEKKETLELIKEIKSNKKIGETAVLLLMKDYNQDFILSAYDENITDYFTLQSTDAEILIRTMWCLKNKLLSDLVTAQRELLEDLNVIDKNTNLYAEEYCDKILDKDIKELQKTGSGGILILLSANEESKIELKPDKIAEAIKTSTRESDLILHGSANRFFVLLKNTPLNGAHKVWDKIKSSLGQEGSINAGISFVGKKSLKELKENLLQALNEAILTKQDYITVANEDEEIIEQEWIDEINAPQKNFKLFKQAFTKKLDKVIVPVFFQMQKLYEDKLFQTEIKQYSKQDNSSFVLKRGNNISEFIITYPGFSKINIEIHHQGLDTPENSHLNLDLTQLNEENLTELLEDFIQEFKDSN